MQLDHFRPESLPAFEHLVNEPLNLHYGCGRCNRWKSNNWPAVGATDTHDGTHGFVDPFAEDRLNYFAVDTDGQIRAVSPPARYMIALLHLEREFLRKLRYKRLLMAEVDERVSALKIELEVDMKEGRLSDPQKMLAIIELWTKVRPLLM